MENPCGIYRSLFYDRTENLCFCSGFFGFACDTNSPIPECSGAACLDTDIGKWEGTKWKVISFSGGQAAQEEQIRLEGGPFLLDLTLTRDTTGVCSLRTTITNTDHEAHTLYGCYPRFVLSGGGFDVYSEFSGWCAEDQGGFTDLHAGNLTLTNSSGCSTTSASPFACLHHKDTERYAAIHVLPIGDWMIRFKRIAGHRTGYTVIEAGLSDAGLRLPIASGASLAMPELLLYGFDYDIRSGSVMLQRYLLRRFPGLQSVDPIYNTWFFNYDDICIDQLREQVQAAARIGCSTFVVDAGWFGKGQDWENQVGCWEECKERAFRGCLKEFADYVRESGMQFGIWMEPERVGRKTEVFLNHPDWFMDEDAIVFDLTNPVVVDYIAGQVKDVVNRYDVRWMKIDYNTDMFRDLTGTNYYYYALAEKELYERIRRENPSCTFEGCAAGGGRTDIYNMFVNYHGHFISDTVHPLEILRMRQSISLRTRTAFTGSWAVLQEVPFPVSTYTNRDKERRTKIISAGDAWWEKTVEYPIQFVLAVNMLGQFGFSGNLASLGERSLEEAKAAVGFAKSHRAMMARSICHLLTLPRALSDIGGWPIFQFEDPETGSHLIFVFRLADEAESILLFPEQIDPQAEYRIRYEDLSRGDGKDEKRTGRSIMEKGIPIHCPMHYEARIIEIIRK